MKITIIAAGNKMPRWVNDCCDDYLGRLSPYKVSLIEVPLLKRSKTSSLASICQKETARLLEVVPSNDWLVVLDERGKSLSTQSFATNIENWQREAKDVCFLIGGPDGIDFSVRHQRKTVWPDQKFSLSALTFPHPLVRVILAEQLYRATSLLAGHPYHRE